MSKNIKRVITFGLLIILCVWAVGYTIAINSAAYASAKKLVLENPKVSEKVGKVQDLRLSYLGFKVIYRLDGGNAYFRVIATGDRQSAEIILSMISKDNVWTIENAKILDSEGNSTDLNL